MKLFKDFSIQKTIIVAISMILAVSVFVSVLFAYVIITETTKDLVYDQASEINKQIVFNYENYTTRINNISNIVQKQISENDVANDQDIRDLIQLFEKLEEIELGIAAITLFDNSGQTIVSTKTINISAKEVAVKNWFKNASYDSSIIHFSAPHKQDIFEFSNQEVITTSKAVDFIDRGRIKKGVILFDMKFKSLESLSKITNLGDGGHLIILDDKDNIVYTSNREKYTKESMSYKIIKDTIFGKVNANIDGKSMAVNINTISSTRWRIATFQNIDTIDNGMDQVFYAIMILLIITMVVTIMVAYIVAKKITKPLQKLSLAITNFQKGHYNSKVEVEGQREVKIVSEGFNEMIDEIQRLMDEVVKEQEGKRKTEIAILQNQINPHFLYNTLDCIIWLAEQKRNEDLVSTVNALSTFFRVSLSKGKQFIPIEEELKHIESYMQIQAVRYNDCFSFQIYCEKELKSLYIMKLLLQPLVENAIYHGIDKEDEDSWIHIDIISKANNILLQVINSGYGISENKITEIYKGMEQGNAKGSLGLQNVCKRIKLFYGPEAELKIESELDESTTVSIIIPREKMLNQLEEKKKSKE